VGTKFGSGLPNALAAGRDFHGNEPVVECPLGNTETPMAVGSGYTPKLQRRRILSEPFCHFIPGRLLILGEVAFNQGRRRQ